MLKARSLAKNIGSNDEDSVPCCELCDCGSDCSRGVVLMGGSAGCNGLNGIAQSFWERFPHAHEGVLLQIIFAVRLWMLPSAAQ